MASEFEKEVTAWLDAFCDWIVDEFVSEEEDIENEEDVEEEELEDEEDDDEVWTNSDVPHVVSIGYCDEYDEVVIMNDKNDPWNVAAALLLAVAKKWPGTDEIDEKLRATLKDLAEDARKNVEAND